MNSLPATRRASDSRARRLTKIALTSGIAVSALLAAAALWASSLTLAVTGVVVAAVAGLVAVRFAWRELAELRAARNAEVRETVQAHSRQLHAVRADHSEVMGILSSRNERLRDEVGQVRAENGELSATVSRLRGDNESLRVENTDLRARLDDDGAAEVVTLPRRRVVTRSAEGWDLSEAETVIDLDLARLATPFVEDALRRHAN